MEVSKLSDWLNAVAYCQVDREGMRRGWHAGWEAGGREVAVTHAACKRGSNWGSGVGLGSERTQNIPLMVVTLDASRLSGWLNAVAPCRVDREGMRRGRHTGWEAGGRWVAATHAACKRGPNWGSGAGHGAERT